MMKKLLTPVIICFLLSTALSQSTDRFIRIVGNASHDFNADGIKIEYSLSETKTDAARNQTGYTMDEVYASFLKHLHDAGIAESALTPGELQGYKYGAPPSRMYSLVATGVSQIEKLRSNAIEGVKVNQMMYIYHSVDPRIEQTMISDAIEDAKRKGLAVCKELDMKLGKVLNIEDASTGCCGEIKDSKEPVTRKTYNVNVTFELKD